MERPVARRRRTFCVAERQLALQDERIGAAVHDNEVGVQHLQPGRGQAVVEPWDKLDLDGHLALGAARDPDQLVVGMRRVRVLLRAGNAVREEVRHDQRAALARERRLEHVGAGEVTPRGLVVVVERRDPEEAGLAPVEDPGEDRARLEAMERAPVDGAVQRDEGARVAVGDERVVGDRRIDRHRSHEAAPAPAVV